MAVLKYKDAAGNWRKLSESQSVRVDAELNESSTNPIQNKAVAIAIESLKQLKQDILVSGTNIKTINGQSIIGTDNDMDIKTPVGSMTYTLYSLSLSDTAATADQIAAFSNNHKTEHKLAYDTVMANEKATYCVRFEINNEYNVTGTVNKVEKKENAVVFNVTMVDINKQITRAMLTIGSDGSIVSDFIYVDNYIDTENLASAVEEIAEDIVNDAMGIKQDRLIWEGGVDLGQNIKTVGGQSLEGPGDIEVTANVKTFKDSKGTYDIKGNGELTLKTIGGKSIFVGSDGEIDIAIGEGGGGTTETVRYEVLRQILTEEDATVPGYTGTFNAYNVETIDLVSKGLAIPVYGGTLPASYEVTSEKGLIALFNTITYDFASDTLEDLVGSGSSEALGAVKVGMRATVSVTLDPEGYPVRPENTDTGIIGGAVAVDMPKFIDPSIPTFNLDVFAMDSLVSSVDDTAALEDSSGDSSEAIYRINPQISTYLMHLMFGMCCTVCLGMDLGYPTAYVKPFAGLYNLSVVFPGIGEEGFDLDALDWYGEAYPAVWKAHYPGALAAINYYMEIMQSEGSTNPAATEMMLFASALCDSSMFSMYESADDPDSFINGAYMLITEYNFRGARFKRTYYIGAIDSAEGIIYFDELIGRFDGNSGDPGSGEGQTIVIDQEVNPDSGNAVSGHAVATYVGAEISDAVTDLEAQISQIQPPTIDVDTTVAEGSTNPVAGGAVKTYVDTAVSGIDIPEVIQTVTESTDNVVSSKGIKEYVDTTVSTAVDTIDIAGVFVGSTDPSSNPDYVIWVNPEGDQSDGYKPGASVVVNTSNTIVNATSGVTYITSFASDAADKTLKVLAYSQPLTNMGQYTFHVMGVSNMTFPSSTLWAGGHAPTFDANNIYEIDIYATKFGDTYYYKATYAMFEPITATAE